MSYEGTELTMNPQEVMKNAKVSGDAFIVSVSTSKGSFRSTLGSFG